MQSIGVFDSGIGGLTVLAEIQKLLPNRNIIYLGDTARVPYGTKSKNTIERFALEDVQFLLSRNVQLIVAACNTVSALALPQLRKNFHVPILGVIEPAVQKALTSTKSFRIGVIGTRATIESQAYEKLFSHLHPTAHIFSKACPLFVPLVEENWIHHPETFSIAQTYLSGLKEHHIDTLILGCTHYPLLADIIQKVMGPEVILINSAQSTAQACVKLLKEASPQKNSSPSSKVQYQFYVTDEPEHFQQRGEKFLGQTISQVEKANLETLEKVIA